MRLKNQGSLLKDKIPMNPTKPECSPTEAAQEGQKKEVPFHLSSGRILVWFSCGAASAIAAKLACEKYGVDNPDLEILYCDTLKFEHEDNPRFMADVSAWIGKPIKILKSQEYEDVDDVFIKRQYVVGIGGASCTRFLKREVRKAYQMPGDTHIFGLTADEEDRIAEFEERNTIETEFILMENGVTKNDCYFRIHRAGIILPAMYLLGYDNNNCIGCVKGGMGYWNKIKRDFPDRFNRVAQVTREIGARLLKRSVNGIVTRHFLDELKPDWGKRMEDEPKFDCGVMCEIPPVESE